VRIYDQHVPAHFSWAEALMRAERFSEADAVFRRLIDLEGSAAAYQGSIQARERGGRWDAALTAALEAAEALPDVGFTAELDRLAMTAVTRDSAGERTDELVWTAWQRHPSADLANALGIRAGKGGDYRRAQSFHEHALRLDPENAVAMNFLGVAAEQRGDESSALIWYRRALAVDPELVAAMVNLASWSARVGMLGEAEQLYRSALALNPGSYEAHNSLGIVLARSGRTAEAKEAFRRAISIDSSLEAARQNLAALEEGR